MANTMILVSCSEGELSVFFACKLRYCTGVWLFGRIEQVRNSKCSMFNELERNKRIIYTVRIIRASTVPTSKYAGVNTGYILLCDVHVCMDIPYS